MLELIGQVSDDFAADPANRLIAMIFGFMIIAFLVWLYFNPIGGGRRRW